MFKFLKLWFKGKVNKGTKSTVPTGPADTTDYKRIAIVVGHTASSKGMTTYTKMSEYDFNCMVATNLVSSKKEIKVFYRDNGGLQGAMTRAAEWKADLVIELHLNGFSKVAYGATVLVPQNDSVSKALATKWLTDFCGKFEIRNRGVVIPKGTWSGKKDRGWINGAYAKMAGVKAYLLVEPCFANFRTVESAKIIDNSKEYENFLVKFIEEL